jgi:ABC-type Co2+ transport system permease subunit
LCGKFYWIGAISGIAMMIPAWAYALTMLEQDKSEQNTCHFNNVCRADIKFLGTVAIPQFGSSKH